MGTPVLEGRDFDAHDGPDSPPVALVSRSLGRRFWRDTSPIGKRLGLPRTNGEPPRTVVGVIADVADAGDVEDTWYVPFAQRAGADGAEELYVMVRAWAGTSAGSLSTPVRKAIARVDPTLGAYSVATMEEVRRQALSRERLGSVLLGVLAAFGTLVALFGAYGVTTYRMERRRGDIGLRIALGAGPARAFRDSLGEGLLPVVLGIAAGTVLTVLESAILRHLVTGVEGVPAGGTLALAAALAAAAAAGLLAPALRLSRLDPAAALKDL